MSFLLLQDDFQSRLKLEPDGWLALESYLQLRPAAETDTAVGFFLPAVEIDAAQVLSLRHRAVVHETDEAQALRYHSRAAAILHIHKLATLQPANEFDAAEALVITHVMSLTLTPGAETDAAQVLSFSAGARIYKTITPVSESG